MPSFCAISDYLKDLIFRLLKVNPSERLDCRNVMQHPWIVLQRQIHYKENQKLVDISDLRAMSVYGQTPILKKMTLMFIGAHLNPTLLGELKQQFESLDQDDSGTVSLEEFHRVVSANIPNASEMPLRSTNMLFQTIDTNENNVIDYSEFKAAVLRSQVYLNEQILAKAFAFFDRDKNGYLSVKELKEVFSNYDDLISMFEFNVFDEILEQVDKDQDGKVNH